VFSIVELKTMALDSGIPGVSPAFMLLIFLMMLSISMIPYALLYISLSEEPGRASSLTVSPVRELKGRPFQRIAA
jgi:hypothetical protein